MPSQGGLSMAGFSAVGEKVRRSGARRRRPHPTFDPQAQSEPSKSRMIRSSVSSKSSAMGVIAMAPDGLRRLPAETGTSRAFATPLSLRTISSPAATNSTSLLEIRLGLSDLDNALHWRSAPPSVPRERHQRVHLDAHVGELLRAAEFRQVDDEARPRAPRRRACAGAARRRPRCRRWRSGRRPGSPSRRASPRPGASPSRRRRIPANRRSRRSDAAACPSCAPARSRPRAGGRPRRRG